MRRVLFIVPLVVSVALVRGGPAFGAEPGGPPEAREAKEPSASEVPMAPVVVDGETLFSVRGLSSFPAGRRAQGIADRIRQVAASGAVGPASMAYEQQDGVTFILTDRGDRLMGVYDADALLEQVSRPLLARSYGARIADTIAGWRRDREPSLLARNAAYALGATVALLLGAALGRRLVRRLEAALERRYQAHIRDLAIQSFQIVRGQQLWRLLHGLLNLAWGLASLAAAFLYLRYVLALFPWTRGTSRSLATVALDPMRSMAQGVIGVIPRLVFLAILFAVVRYVLKLVRLFFEGVGAGTVTLRNFQAEWAIPTYRLMRLLIVAFALVIAYPHIPGSQSDAFKGVSLFVGFVFSLGSSSLIGNLIAGYSLMYRRAFRIGDRVQIGENLGDVEQVRLLVTHLRTLKNEEVVVPNSTILTTEVVNFSSMARQRGLILHSTVGIGYETSWRQVEAMLREAARRTPGLLPEPPPFVLQKALGDFCVTYEINVYTDAPQRMLELYTELHRNVLDVFNEYGVQIMTPAYERDPASPKVVPPDQWYAPPAEPPASPGTRSDARDAGEAREPG